MRSLSALWRCYLVYTFSDFFSEFAVEQSWLSRISIISNSSLCSLATTPQAQSNILFPKIAHEWNSTTQSFVSHWACVWVTYCIIWMHHTLPLYLPVGEYCYLVALEWYHLRNLQVHLCVDMISLGWKLGITDRCYGWLLSILCGCQSTFKNGCTSLAQQCTLTISILKRRRIKVWGCPGPQWVPVQPVLQREILS